ncbi:PRA1 family protein [Entamoeba marina]
MQSVVNLINNQIEKLITGEYGYETTNLQKRIYESIDTFYPTYSVMYYYTFLIITAFFPQLYSSTITTLFLVLLGNLMVANKLTITFNHTNYVFNPKVFLISCMIIPIVPSFLNSVIHIYIPVACLSSIPFCIHALLYRKPPKVKFVIE